MNQDSRLIFDPEAARPRPWPAAHAVPMAAMPPFGFLGSVRRGACGCGQAVPQFVGESGQDSIVIGDGQIPAGIGESEPDSQPSIDAERAIWVRAIQRLEPLHEIVNTRALGPLREQRLTEGVGLSVRGTDARRDGPKGRTRRRGSGVDG